MAMARVRTIFTGVPGTPWYSNIYFMDDGGTPIGPTAITWVSAFWNVLSAGMHPSVSMTTLAEVAKIDEVNGNLVGLETGTASTHVGTATSEPLPWATQGLVTMSTNAFVHSRRVRGRIFIPGFTEIAQTNGTPGAATVSAFKTAADTMMTSSTGTLCVWSRPWAGSPTNPARLGSKHAVIANSGGVQWAVMRSRRD